MKSARECAMGIKLSDDWSESDAAIVAAIEARDAEHRAEIERLKAELEAVRLVCACGAFELANRAPTPVESTWASVAKNAAEVATWPEWKRQGSGLGVSPSKSTPVPCTASAGSCNSPKACGEAGRCIDARMREVVVPAESTPVHEFVPSRTGACMECGKAIGERPPHPPEPAPPDDIEARLERLEEWASMRERGPFRITALEAKGEPVTHADDVCSACRKTRANHVNETCDARQFVPMKGAKP